MVKVCPKCSKNSVVKNGKKRGKQAYKCGLCCHRFVGKGRDRGESSKTVRLRREYIEGKQTYEQIANKIGRDKRTVQRMFDREIPWEEEFYNGKLNKMPIVLIGDCTRFGSTGFIVMKSHQHKKVIYAKAFEGEENVKLYVEAVNYLKLKGRIIRGIVCDGLKGLRQIFVGIPFQSCQFHQVKNMVKYLTKKPKSEASNLLLSIAYQLKASTYQEFSDLLEGWEKKYGEYIKERTYNIDGSKRRYTHKRLRSAHKSLKNNMCVLFTYKMHDGMPNTSNELEGYFKLIKAKTSIHNGLEEERKKRVVLALFSI